MILVEACVDGCVGALGAVDGRVVEESDEKPEGAHYWSFVLQCMDG